MTAVILVTVIVTLIVNEVSDLCPWLAVRLVRWSAFCRYCDRQRAETRADELAALIRARPGSLFKLLTAVGFAASAIAARPRTPSREIIAIVAGTTFQHVMAEIALANGNTLIIPDCILGTHLADCKPCRRKLWLSDPGAMLLYARTIRRQLVSPERGWSLTAAGTANQAIRPYPVVLTMPPHHRG